jgi:predicted AlkP superfamily phosphohydrolase/phosphomutase
MSIRSSQKREWFHREKVLWRKEQMGRVLVVGLDGVSPGVFDIIDQRNLPTLGRMAADGVRGVSKSVYSPVSPCAWTSIATGKNPGKTGIFGFIIKRGYEEIPVNTHHLKDDCIWDILSGQDKKVIVGNIPSTYPPYAVNGIMISGMMAPLGVDNRTYPGELFQELLREVGYAGGRMTPSFKKKQETEAEGFLVLNHSEVSLFDYLRKAHDWDFMMFNFQSTDGVQHQLGPMNETLIEMLKTIDQALTRVLAQEKDISIFIISDHGQERREARFRVNQWLINEGYLSLRTKNLSSSMAILRRLLIDRQKIKAVARKLLPQRVFTHLMTEFADRARGLVPRKSLTLNEINWAETKAYAMDSGTIFINLKGREPEGIVAPGDDYENLREEILKKLTEVEWKGEKCFRRDSVFRGEDVWWGSSSNDQPDLVFWDARVNPTNWSADGEVFKKLPGGGHSLEGVVMAYGPDIRRGTISADVMDIAPTVLHLMDVPIPADIDGRVMDIFTAWSGPGSREPTSVEPELGKQKSGTLTAEERKLVEEKLRGLGYIG